MRLDSILLPTDLGENMQPAYQWTRLLSGFNQGYCKITLLHFPPMPQPAGNFLLAGDFTAGFLDLYITRAQQVLEMAAESDELKGLNLHPVIVSTPDNDLAGNLSQYAEKHHPDLVVLNARGRSKGFLGPSQLFRIIRKLKSPALVAGADSPSAFHGRIAFATDFSRPNFFVFKELEKFAKLSSATLLPFFVNTPAGFITQAEFREKTIAFSQATGYRDRANIRMVNAMTVTEGIDHFTEDNLCDMVAIAHQEGASENGKGFFQDSFTETLLTQTKLPVLVFPAPKMRA